MSDIETAKQAGKQEPLFWYRPCGNGMYEGPIHNAQIEEIRKHSGAWVPLVAANAAPEDPAQDPSPTAGMSMAGRILHVGGRNNAAGYVEFGSIQAVEALVRQVLRDIPAAQAAPVQGPDAYLHDDGYWTAAKTEVGRRLNDRLVHAGSPTVGVYVAPLKARPDRAPLTDEQIEDLCWTEVDQRLRSFARAIETAHGIAETARCDCPSDQIFECHSLPNCILKKGGAA